MQKVVNNKIHSKPTLAPQMGRWNPRTYCIGSMGAEKEHAGFDRPIGFGDGYQGADGAGEQRDDGTAETPGG